MNEDLHDIEPVITANEGWHQMRCLLDQHLPVAAAVKARPPFRRVAAAATLFTILLGTSIQLNTGLRLSKPGAIFSAAAKTEINQSGNAEPEKYNDNKHLNQPAVDELAFINGSVHLPGNSQPSIPVNEGVTTYMTPRIYGMIDTGTPPTAPVHGITISDPGLMKITAANSSKAGKQGWSLAAGVGMNTSLSRNQYLQPYPVIEVKRKLGRRLYVAAGLAFLSPVSTTTGGVSKTVYLNDTVNNIRLYNEVTTHRQLKYVDMPLSLGVEVTKRLSVQAGVQVSMLINRKVTKDLEPFDYQMRNVSVPLISPVVSAGASPEQEYDVQVHKADYRLVTGVHYTLNRLSAGLTYQHALQPTGKGNHVNANRNKVVSLSLMYKIK